MHNHMATIREAQRRIKKERKHTGSISITRFQIEALLYNNPSMNMTPDEVWNKVKACLESQDGLDGFLDFILNK